MLLVAAGVFSDMNAVAVAQVNGVDRRGRAGSLQSVATVVKAIERGARRDV